MIKLINLSLSLFFFSLFGVLSEGVESTNYYGDYKNHSYFKYLDEVGEKIMYKVDNSKKVIYIPKENTPYCKNNPGYAAYVDWPNRNGTDFVICSSRLIRGNSYENSYYAINAAVRHEAVHSAQFCRYTSYNDFLLYPLGVVETKELLKYKKFVPDEGIYAGIPIQQRLAEMEANYFEDKPYSVLNQLNKYCY